MKKVLGSILVYLNVSVGQKLKCFNIYRRRWHRINGWYGSFQSAGGKEVLLKFVAMVMTVFAMSVFKLPNKTCQNFTSAMENSWWNAQEGKNKMHWVSWERTCLDKENGGLWFRDLEKFNQALLVKQGWRLLMFDDSLCARVVRSIYYPEEDFISTCLGSRLSFAWRSIFFEQ